MEEAYSQVLGVGLIASIVLFFAGPPAYRALKSNFPAIPGFNPATWLGNLPFGGRILTSVGYGVGGAISAYIILWIMSMGWPNNAEVFTWSRIMAICMVGAGVSGFAYGIGGKTPATIVAIAASIALLAQTAVPVGDRIAALWPQDTPGNGVHAQTAGLAPQTTRRKAEPQRIVLRSESRETCIKLPAEWTIEVNKTAVMWPQGGRRKESTVFINEHSDYIYVPPNPLMVFESHAGALMEWGKVRDTPRPDEDLYHVDKSFKGPCTLCFQAPFLEDVELLVSRR